MAQLMDHVTYLSKEIGPRPAGTEEEQRAALYITEQFQKETGFAASMEDFSSSSNVEAGLAVMAAVGVVATILSMIFPVLAIPAFILAAAAAVVYTLEEFDKPIISRVLSRGASQNVIAKYQPAGGNESGLSRRTSSRKIVLMAHYDTGNVTPALVGRVEGLPFPVALVCVGGVIAAAFFLLIRIFVASGGGMALLVLNVLSIIAIVVCIYPIVKAALIKSSPYNEGATNNATGTAALLEVARRISRGSVSEAELADVEEGVVIHGEEAARAEGLIPEGVQIVYEAGKIEPPSEIGDYDEEERLLSAKAAIAALTGKPVERKVYSSVADNLVNSRADGEGPGADAVRVAGTMSSAGDEGFAESGGALALASATSAALGEDKGEDIDGFENAPSWFVAAQQNARKPDSERNGAEPQVRRSKYIEAIEGAERVSAQREEEMRAAEQAQREAELRAREEEMREAVKAQMKSRRAEQERRALEEGQIGPDGNGEPGFMPIVYKEDEAAGQNAEGAKPLLSPYGTVAMPAPTPSAEIIAEALAEDQAASLRSIPNPAEGGNPVLDSASIPSLTVEPDGQNRMELPPIDPVNPYSAQANARGDGLKAEQLPSPSDEPSRSGILRKLRTSIPSLSGLMSPVQSKPETTRGEAGQREKVDYNMEIPLVTPSADQAVPAAGKGAGTVDIPRSRSGNFMNRMRQSEGENLVDTPQQWLDVDKDFDPRSVGRERGGWESFRDDRYSGDGASASTRADDDREQAGGSWQGGAYSRVQLGHVSTLSGDDTETDKPFVEEPLEAEAENAVAEEMEQIYHFRNPLFNMEIWFVAIGADGASHDGARAFIDEHRDELRGAMMIEVESLGAGNLSVASEEGRVRKMVASSRAKRYTRSATATTGLAVNSVSLVGADSIASTLQKEGFQAMHLFGAEDGRPALKGSADDVLENVDEVALDEHVNYIYEMLKQ